MLVMNPFQELSNNVSEHIILHYHVVIKAIKQISSKQHSIFFFHVSWVLLFSHYFHEEVDLLNKDNSSPCGLVADKYNRYLQRVWVEGLLEEQNVVQAQMALGALVPSYPSLLQTDSEVVGVTVSEEPFPEFSEEFASQFCLRVISYLRTFLVSLQTLPSTFAWPNCGIANPSLLLNIQ